MGVLFVAGLLVGIILGRFFKVLILVPACALAVALTCLRSFELQQTVFLLVAQILAVMTSLQIGFIVSALFRTSLENLPAGRKTWARAASAAWRSVHSR